MLPIVRLLASCLKVTLQHHQNLTLQPCSHLPQNRAVTVPFAAGVFLVRGVIGANGGGISVGPFLLGVDGTLFGRVPARGFLTGGSIISSCLFSMGFIALCSAYGKAFGGRRMYSVFSELGTFGCWKEAVSLKLTEVAQTNFRPFSSKPFQKNIRGFPKSPRGGTCYTFTINQYPESAQFVIVAPEDNIHCSWKAKQSWIQ